MDLSNRSVQGMDHLDFGECIGTLLERIASERLTVLLARGDLLGIFPQRKTLFSTVLH